MVRGGRERGEKKDWNQMILFLFNTYTRFLEGGLILYTQSFFQVSLQCPYDPVTHFDQPLPDI